MKVIALAICLYCFWPEIVLALFIWGGICLFVLPILD